jgi:Na+:H+ antiporter, NhaA family
MLSPRKRRVSGAGTPPGTVISPSMLTPPFVRDYDHSLGDGGPALVLFGDYEDPASAQAHRVITTLQETRTLTYAWRHLPIAELHEHANGAALAAECAAAQDAFWAFHHVLLARQDALSVPDLLNYAGQIGLQVSVLMEDLMDEQYAERVLDDIRSAVGSGVKSTPALFIDGERFEPEITEEALRAALAG